MDEVKFIRCDGAKAITAKAAKRQRPQRRTRKDFGGSSALRDLCGHALEIRAPHQVKDVSPQRFAETQRTTDKHFGSPLRLRNLCG
jgi:hypothetical protein